MNRRMGKPKKKGSKTFHWTLLHTEGEFMKQNEQKKIGKLEKKGSRNPPLDHINRGGIHEAK
jgi:hypothetical protein